MKKLITAVGTVALLAAAVLPAFGASNSCTNGTTGPGSNNTCTINNATSVTVNNVNDTKIVNNVSLKASTGNNSASNNTLGGNITAGNATLNSTVSSIGNINTTNITVGSAGGSNTGANDVTGPYSRNEAFITNAQNVKVYNSGTASVDNNVNEEASTGDNRANNNTGPASIRTGNASLYSGVLTHVNDNWTALSLGANGSGNNTAGSGTTGPFSFNQAVINNATSLDVDNVNDLKVANNVLSRAETGRNSASNNTLGGSVVSGNALSDMLVNTEGNINTTQVVAAMGGFDNVAGNEVTGPGSDAKSIAYINNTRSLVFDNWNNKCDSHNASRLGCDPDDLGVINNVNSLVDAGMNAGDNNTGGGSIVAGGFATMVQEVLTHLNDVINDIRL